MKLGIIDGLKGFNDRRNNKKNLMSRYWATELLIARFDEFLVVPVVERVPSDKPVRLRDCDKNDLNLEDMKDGDYGISLEEYQLMENNINLYNDFASKQEVLLQLHCTEVTYDFLLKLRMWFAKGQVEIYKANN